MEAFGLDDLWAAEADAAAGGGAAGGPSDPAGAAGGPDGAGSLQVFDSLLLLAETYPDPETYLSTWDRLLAAEEAHEGVGDDTLAREESEEDRVVIGTIHAAKGREYDAVVIPDYDCDVSRWEPPQVEEERRVVYVGVTRARDTALFTVDTSVGFVHPFLRELVEPPETGRARGARRLARGRDGRAAAPSHRRPPHRDRGAVPRARAGGRRRGPSGRRRQESVPGPRRRCRRFLSMITLAMNAADGLADSTSARLRPSMSWTSAAVISTPFSLK